MPTRIRSRWRCSFRERIESYREPLAWLRRFRGYQTVTALGIIAELHDFRSFRTPRDLMGYLGLLPSESTSADSLAPMVAHAVYNVAVLGLQAR